MGLSEGWDGCGKQRESCMNDEQSFCEDYCLAWVDVNTGLSSSESKRDVVAKWFCLFLGLR